MPAIFKSSEMVSLPGIALTLGWDSLLTYCSRGSSLMVSRFTIDSTWDLTRQPSLALLLYCRERRPYVLEVVLLLGVEGMPLLKLTLSLN